MPNDTEGLKVLQLLRKNIKSRKVKFTASSDGDEGEALRELIDVCLVEMGYDLHNPRAAQLSNQVYATVMQSFTGGNEFKDWGKHEKKAQRKAMERALEKTEEKMDESPRGRSR